MKDAIPMIAVGVIALLVGAAATWFVLDAGEAPNTSANHTADAAGGGNSQKGDEPLTVDDSGTSVERPSVDSELEAMLATSKKRVSDLEKENRDLRQAKADLEAEKTKLEGDVVERENRIKELEDVAAGPNRLLIGFGKWSEMKEIREADWASLGDTYAKMIPLLKELKEARAQGKTPDPELVSKIQTLNSNLVSHYIKVMKKLPTHVAQNGEFTHPINMVNFLAGQLQEAGMPLSDDQKSQLSKLGETYDERWNSLQDSYTGNTWLLQKIYDEADLKQWFYDEMFKVTTPEQKAVAVPPEVEGLVGLDLYSPGLMLQGNFQQVRGTDVAEIRTQLKQGISDTVGIPLETLNQAEYVFDDWFNGAQLQPVTTEEANSFRTRDLIRAAKLQLAGMHALDDGYVVDEEVHKKFRFQQRIGLLQLIKQE